MLGFIVCFEGMLCNFEMGECEVKEFSNELVGDFGVWGLLVFGLDNSVWVVIYDMLLELFFVYCCDKNGNIVEMDYVDGGVFDLK